MSNNTDTRLAFGRQNYPKTVRAAWGARLIFPNDLIWNRQDVIAIDDEAKQQLIAWLNGPGRGDGALSKALEVLRAPYTLGLATNNDTEAVIYEDEEGKIIGSAQSSHGYLYVCGWLHAHVPTD